MIPDVGGEFLLATAAVIDPSLPFQYIATVDFTPGAASATMDIELQPLALDLGSTTSPRTPVGAPVSALGVVVAADGSFTADFGGFDLPGASNPITGSSLTLANIVFDGQILSEDLFCGDVTGAVTFPLAIDLAGSTFAATRVADTSPGGLPAAFPSSCP